MARGAALAINRLAYWFNERKGNDSDRFVKAMKSLAGKHLTYGELTGKDTKINTYGLSVGPNPSAHVESSANLALSFRKTLSFANSGGLE